MIGSEFSPASHLSGFSAGSPANASGNKSDAKSSDFRGTRNEIGST